MKFTRIALALAAALAAAPVSSADLVTLYRDARVSDPVYQAARSQYQATSERLPQARSGYLPQIAATGGIFRNHAERDGVGDRDYSTKTIAVTLSQPIFRLQNWIAIGQAQNLVLQAEVILAASLQDLALRLAQAYFDVLLAQDNVALSETQKAAIDQQLAQAKRNFEVGTATIVDTLEAQARYDQSVAKAIADLNDLEVKRRALQVLLGKTPDGLTPLREPLPLAPPTPDDIEAWVKVAIESSFNVISARANLEIAQQEVRRQRAGHLPTLDLSGSLARVDDPNSALPPVSPVSNVGSIGLTLSVPIFSGGLTQSRVREAVALRDRAEQDYENVQRNVAQQVRTSFLNVTSGIAQVRALEQALVSTQSQLDSTILGRDVGVRTSVDVLNAQQQVIQTRRDLLQGRYNYLLNTLRLKAAAGQLAEPDIEEVNRALARG
ncbi:MAG: TolC family outer membrane protein [Pseudomonadota bacterium]|nr:TolC family outer membrane protein [Pseudomonadota bacterium]